MVEAKIQETQSDYLKPGYVKTKQFTRVVILDEFKLVESEFEDQKTHEKTKKSSYTGKVECQIPNEKPEIKIWSMNKTSSNSMIRVLGGETKTWIGCTVRITVSQVASNESILVDEIGTRELNPLKATLLK